MKINGVKTRVGSGEKWSDSEYIPKVEPRGFAGGLVVE